MNFNILQYIEIQLFEKDVLFSISIKALNHTELVHLSDLLVLTPGPQLLVAEQPRLPYYHPSLLPLASLAKAGWASGPITFSAGRAIAPEPMVSQKDCPMTAQRSWVTHIQTWEG